MKWKYEAIDKLKYYVAKKNAAQTIPEELKRLKEAATAIRSSTSDSTPVKGGGSGREDMLLNNIAKRQELEQNLHILQGWLAPVEKAMACLTEKEMQVLDSFYIHPAKGCVDKLCEELGCEKSSVYNWRNDALYHFTIALYGYSET